MSGFLSDEFSHLVGRGKPNDDEHNLRILEAHVFAPASYVSRPVQDFPQYSSKIASI
jgi:hypothetical protein